MAYKLSSSRYLKVIYVVLVAITVLLIIAISQSMWLSILFNMIIVAIGLKINPSPYANYHIMPLDEKHWLLESVDSQTFEGIIQGDSMVTNWFCLLILKSANRQGCKTILILKDMLPQKQFHYLKLQLKGYLF